MTAHILLVENSNITKTESLAPNLTAQEFQTFVAHTPPTISQKLETLWPNLVIINTVSNNLDLSHIQQAIDQTDLSIPTILISNATHLPQELHTDTIVVRANNPEQLTQSIENAVARQQDRFIRLPNLIVDCQKHQVLHNKKRYSLTPKEFKLLTLLIANRDSVLSRKKIMREVWETDYMGDTRTLDVHIRWIREKIELQPSHPHRLITVRGVGYHFITHISE